MSAYPTSATPRSPAGAWHELRAGFAGAVFALLSRGPMAAGGPSAAPVLVVGGPGRRVVVDPAFTAGDPAAVAQLLALVAAAVGCMGVLQTVLGLSALVRFAKFVPQPVLGGFINGVALLALLALDEPALQQLRVEDPLLYAQQ